MDTKYILYYTERAKLPIRIKETKTSKVPDDTTLCNAIKEYSNERFSRTETIFNVVHVPTIQFCNLLNFKANTQTNLWMRYKFDGSIVENYQYNCWVFVLSTMRSVAVDFIRSAFPFSFTLSCFSSTPSHLCFCISNRDHVLIAHNNTFSSIRVSSRTPFRLVFIICCHRNQHSRTNVSICHLTWSHTLVHSYESEKNVYRERRANVPNTINKTIHTLAQVNIIQWKFDTATQLT